MQYVELKTKNGIIRGLFNQPLHAKTLVIMFHGYTGHKNENGSMFKQLANRLFENNIASLRFDFYGSGDSDGEFHDMTFDTEIDDAKAIIEYGISLKIEKLILLGFSMGGAIASLVAKDYPNIISKLILIAPAGNMNEVERFYQSPNWYDESYLDLGGYLLSKAFLESLASRNLFDSIGTYQNPVLIIQGTSDQAVLPKVSKQYTDYYQNVKYLLVDGANHCFQKVDHRKELSKAIITFINDKENY